MKIERLSDGRPSAPTASRNKPMPNARNAELLWQEWRRLAAEGDGGVPKKAALDPARLVPVLPDMLIYQNLGNPEDWRLRLMGTRVVDRVGRDATGLNPLDLMHGDNRSIARDAFLRVLRDPAGHLCQVADEYPGGMTSLVEVLRLPLRNTDGSIDLVVSVTQELHRKHDRPPADTKPKLLAQPVKSVFFGLTDSALPF